MANAKLNRKPLKQPKPRIAPTKNSALDTSKQGSKSIKKSGKTTSKPIRDTLDFPGNEEDEDEEVGNAERHSVRDEDKKATASTRKRTRAPTAAKASAKRQKLSSAPTPSAAVSNRLSDTEANNENDLDVAQILHDLANQGLSAHITSINDSLVAGPPSTSTRSQLNLAGTDKSSAKRLRAATLSREKEGPTSTSRQQAMSSVPDQTHNDAASSVAKPQTRSAMHQKQSGVAPVANMGVRATRQPVAQSAMQNPEADSAKVAAEASALAQQTGAVSQESTSTSVSAASPQTEHSESLDEPAQQNTTVQEVQSLMSQEIASRDLPTIRNQAFLGLGRKWNEIVKERKQLLNCPQVKGTWPLSRKGKKTLEILSTDYDDLRTNIRTIQANLGTFNKDELQQPKKLHADLCHLIIPRIIRCIQVLASKHSYFSTPDDETDTHLDLEVVEIVSDLLERLCSLSHIPSNLKDKGEAIGVHNDFAGALDIVAERSYDLHTTTDKYFRRAKAKLEDQNREQDLEKWEQDRERKKLEFQRKLEAKREEIRKKLADEKEEARRHAIEEQEEKEHQALLKAQGEAELKAERNVERERDRCRREEEAQTESDYWERMSQKVAKPIRSTTVSMNKLSRSALYSARGISWTQELNRVLIDRLAMFGDLGLEAKYARCLDCRDLQMMSMEMIRARALEIKPSLEDYYIMKRLQVPEWISSIA